MSDQSSFLELSPAASFDLAWDKVFVLSYSFLTAVLESEVFGPYIRPDYATLVGRRNAKALCHGETAQHNVKGSEAGIMQPSAGELARSVGWTSGIFECPIPQAFTRTLTPLLVTSNMLLIFPSISVFQRRDVTLLLGLSGLSLRVPGFCRLVNSFSELFLKMQWDSPSDI